MPVWIIISVVAVYVIGLFAIGFWGERRAKQEDVISRPIIYSLALAVYCTSWTFYGGVGTAASRGWEYAAIYAGPMLVFLLLPGLVRRIGAIAQRERINSLSDFLSARYGKSRSLAALATLAAVVGSLPYIALQLKSVGMSFSALARTYQPSGENNHDTVLAVALAMATFSVLFGTRKSDTTDKNSGLMHVLAFESLIKLAALLLVAIISISGIRLLSSEQISVAMESFSTDSFTARFFTAGFLSMAAILCLPRQFHVAIIERNDDNESRLARWAFPIYLAFTTLVVLPITVAGSGLLPANVSPDLFVIELPLAQDEHLTALLVFLGGFSAATGMVIVSSIALSTMITNDLIVPWFLRSGRFDGLSGDAGTRLLLVRRVSIFAILLLSYGYYRIAGDSSALAQIGFLSFAAALQFAPGLIGGIYWRSAHRNGALFGLLAGMVVWGYCLFLPAILPGVFNSVSLPDVMDPQALFGIELGDSLTHGVVWSIGVNLAVFIVVSVMSPERLRDRIQASAFVDQGPVKLGHGTPALTSAFKANASPDGLKTLAGRFLNHEAVEHAFQKFHDETGRDIHGDGQAHWELVKLTEKLLASALGASSARVVMASAVGGQDIPLGDMLAMLDQGTQADRFERHMLQSTLENISQGISVVDHDQKLVAWNAAYVELFDYPPELVRLGVPISQLIEHNILSGWITGKDPSDAAARRIEYMKTGKPHYYERQNPDGRHLRIEGNPMPGGGYVTTFTDITVDKERERALIEANETLEERVEQRTEELQALTDDLNVAKLDAEGANASKTRFLAAASHDLLQPLNAARLFVGAATSRSDQYDDQMLKTALLKADKAIQSADELLKGLLDISRLDHGSIKVNPTSVKLSVLMADLVDEAAPMAAQNGLSIRMVPTSLSVIADPDFLQAILRNFISNARRYTETGGLVVGARRRGADKVAIQVWDTGRGIPADRIPLIFDEFSRFEETDTMGVRGAGLGLSIVSRLARLMNAELNVRSEPGRGSMFEVVFPIADIQEKPARQARRAEAQAVVLPLSLRVLCVDDEPTILSGMRTLLEAWGCEVETISDPKRLESVLESGAFDAVIADYQLNSDLNGFGVLDRARSRITHADNMALLTANSSDEVHHDTAVRNYRLLRKPVSTDELRSFLSACEARAHLNDAREVR
ncbi:MAG: hypothetical protein CMK07_07240 [Ponticaulis sp.]|nr:hypothetical protein [Ponticaulis sp.]